VVISGGKMGIIGIMVFDETASTEERVKAACEAFEKRFEMKASHVEIPLGEVCMMEGVIIRNVQHVRAHHALAGVPA
jgi:hypothetical protein